MVSKIDKKRETKLVHYNSLEENWVTTWYEYFFDWSIVSNDVVKEDCSEGFRVPFTRGGVIRCEFCVDIYCIIS